MQPTTMTPTGFSRSVCSLVWGPALLTILVAYRTLRFPAAVAVALGVITGMAVVVVLFAALVIACADCDL
jgi:hypothetical protein